MSIVAPARTARTKRAADGLYGTILALAVVAALSKDEEATAAMILGGVLTTALAFWLVHVYAEVLARRAFGEASGLRPEIIHAARQEWPLVQAAIAPSIPLLLWGIGVLGRRGGITLSLIVGLGDLAAWGFLAGRAARQSRTMSAVSALAAVLLGTGMVLLKNLVH